MVVVIIVGLLILLCFAVSFAAALVAAMVTSAFGKSRFIAICNGAGVFVATFTLIILVFMFVETVAHDHQQPRVGGPAAMEGRDGGRNGRMHPWAAGPLEG